MTTRLILILLVSLWSLPAVAAEAPGVSRRTLVSFPARFFAPLNTKGDGATKLTGTPAAPPRSPTIARDEGRLPVSQRRSGRRSFVRGTLTLAAFGLALRAKPARAWDFIDDNPVKYDGSGRRIDDGKSPRPPQAPTKQTAPTRPATKQPAPKRAEKPQAPKSAQPRGDDRLSAYHYPFRSKGTVTTPFWKWRSAGQYHHRGVDIAGFRKGTRIRAVTDGIVVRRQKVSGYGRAVYVKRSDGLLVIYGHLASYGVKMGQQVRAGEDVIGGVGNSGRVRASKGSDGTHLHLEFRKGKGYLNPLKYM